MVATRLSAAFDVTAICVLDRAEQTAEEDGALRAAPRKDVAPTFTKAMVLRDGRAQGGLHTNAGERDEGMRTGWTNPNALLAAKKSTTKSFGRDRRESTSESWRFVEFTDIMTLLRHVTSLSLSYLSRTRVMFACILVGKQAIGRLASLLTFKLKLRSACDSPSQEYHSASLRSRSRHLK